MNKKSLIFGMPGQDSWFLSNLLIDRGDHVTGCHRHTYLSDSFEDFQSDKMDFYTCDMMDRQAVDNIIDLVKPDEIYNLAANSFVGESFKSPQQTINNNITSHVNLLESVRKLSPKSKIYYAGSSEELEIKSPYGVSKAAVKQLNDIYRSSYDMFICHAQNFNHSSWRHSPQFLFPKVMKYVANLCRWLKNYKIVSTSGPLIQGQCIYGNASFSWLPKLELGDISTTRDVSYAGDVMRAAIVMMGQDKSDTYKVASGQLHNMYTVVHYAFDFIKLNYEDFIIQDPKLIRPKNSEPTPNIEQCLELRVLGWEPSTDLKCLVRSTINEYLKRGIK